MVTCCARSVVDMGDANGLTPLHYAAFFKRHRVVTVLCELGASLYAASIWAATSAMVSVVPELLSLEPGLPYSRAFSKSCIAAPGDAARSSFM